MIIIIICIENNNQLQAHVNIIANIKRRKEMRLISISTIIFSFLIGSAFANEVNVYSAIQR